MEEGESEADAKTKLDGFLSDAAENLKKSGFKTGPDAQGNDGNGQGTPPSDDDKALLADANKYYSTTMESCTDDEKIGIMKNKITRNLHKLGEGPIALKRN